jgi:hypothetical protein
LPKAITTRGTPKGYYEIVRTATTDLTYSTGLFNVAGLAVPNISFVFTPVEIYISTGIYIPVDIYLKRGG